MLFQYQGFLNIGYSNSKDYIFRFSSKLLQQGSSNYTDIQGIKLIRIVYSFLYSFLFRFRFSIRYRVSIRFRFRFFKYSFYSQILVLLISLYSKVKLLLSLGQYSSQGRFIEFSRISRSLVDISRNLILVEFGGIFRSLVDIGRILRLVDLSIFFRFQF